MSTPPAINDPWAEYRRRWRPYYITLGAFIASMAMFANEHLFHIWQRLAVLLIAVFLVFYWRILQLECPRCGEAFYWPAKLVWRRCVHCGLKEYAPIDLTRPGDA